jgi:hypothetical protein
MTTASLTELLNEIRQSVTAARIEVDHMDKNDLRRGEKIALLGQHERWLRILTRGLQPCAGEDRTHGEAK